MFLSHTLVAILPFLFLAITFTSSTLESFYKIDREHQVMNTANVIAGNISKYNYLADEKKMIFLNEDLQNKSKEGGYRILVFDNTGTVVTDTNGLATNKVYLVPEVLNALNNNDDEKLHEYEKSIYASASIFDENSKVVGAVLLVSSVDDIYSLLNKIKDGFLVYLGALSAFIAILAFFISNLFLAPFKKISHVVEKMSDGHLEQRIDIKSKDEFAEIASGFNDMAEKLQNAEITRDEFVSNVSHELKTPLSSIKVLTESILLQENVPNEKYIEFLEDINSETDRMTNIVNDLLTLVKLDRREITLNMKNFSLNDLIEDIVKSLSRIAYSKNVKVILVEEREVDLYADEMKLSLAISNLVENGIKYTPEGGSVTVKVDADHQSAFIIVEDTGIGINEEEQGKIFTRFYRVDKTRDRETGGTGLGLSITHSTVLLHKGSIKINSKEGEGSTFIVRIPLSQSKKEG